MAKEQVKHYEPGKGLEQWLKEQDPMDFPAYSVERGEKSYPDRYEEVKLALAPIHNNVEKGAMVASFSAWIKKAKEKITQCDEESCQDQSIHDELFESDPAIYLNNHGSGHVNKVIEKVSEMLNSFNYDNLSPYEVFMLLCAIQLHDVGNIFGRAEHEKRIKNILDSKCKLFIPDGVERRVIEQIALVHSGKIFGDKDTISYLDTSEKIHDRRLRKRLLAALLRFGDELADDSSRADREGLLNGTIPEASQIYHYYSQSLHTVSIAENEENKKLELNLAYEFESDVAFKTFIKINEDKYLLDEIYDRTLKMEQERRYCMRFLRPNFSLESIKVRIVIQHSTISLKNYKYEYTLEEKGYPSVPRYGNIKDIVSDIATGDEFKALLAKEGDGHGNCN